MRRFPLASIQIRPARADDYHDLCDLFDEVDELHRAALPCIFRKPPDPVREREYVLGLMADPNVLLLVADLGGMLAGLAYVLVRDTPLLPVFAPRRYAIIDSIIVTSSVRRQGVGQLLADEVERWARARGAASIELNVYEFNTAALQFYETLGYSTLSRKMSKSL
jgi:ribosomal protein S18 acetylase RimI-like enzyme